MRTILIKELKELDRIFAEKQLKTEKNYEKSIYYQSNSNVIELSILRLFWS